MLASVLPKTVKTFRFLQRLSRITCIAVVLALAATTRAETLLDNLGPEDFHTAGGGAQVGGAIQVGSTPVAISTVQFHQFFTGGYRFTPGQTFAIHSRNADGTVGAVLFSDFTVEDGGTTLLTRAIANSAVVLQANTGYWLVLSAPPDEEVVIWNFTKSSAYNSAFDVTIPPQRASFYRENGQNYYFALTEGPQELRVTGSAVTPPAPMPEGAVSRMIHGSAGTHDIELPLNGNGIEPRSGGPANDFQLVVDFPQPVTFQTAAVTSGRGTVTSAAVNRLARDGTGTSITINLTAVDNAQRLTVTLFGVSNGSGSGDVLIRFSVLLGDTTMNGSVTASDIAATKQESGQPVTAVNFQSDVTANGSITASDLGLVKSQSGAALPMAR